MTADRLHHLGEADQKPKSVGSNGARSNVIITPILICFCQVGRGLRLSPDTGKEDCYIIDIVDSMSDGLVVSPTLLGLTHDELEEKEEEREPREETGKDELELGEGGSNGEPDWPILTPRDSRCGPVESGSEVAVERPELQCYLYR